jgi:hypothetical protein
MVPMMEKNETETIRKFDWFYFLALGLLIIVLTTYIIYSSNEHRKLLHIEEKTLLYLDKELCERVKFLETVSVGFKETHKVPKDCNAYDKLEFQRIMHNE